MRNEPKNSKTLRGLLKFSLSTREMTINDLAKSHGINGSTLCVAFSRPYPRGERIIAEVLNLPAWEVWPDRYGPDRRPNRENLWYKRKKGLWPGKTVSVSGDKVKNQDGNLEGA